ncbi:hypothetical protein KJY73_09100 [Bowmanella sp. Y26]|uniref:hypothetical protein n=1 Tax=Bowmanella yangjiangensis TaxID=2811230 RepID=UPI001BDD749C|nr:hypothetical protein [Bowmanella yangjiangensis]MBT1063728.1 hypothetical protein [Bowmanella yangjiangensis]
MKELVETIPSYGYCQEGIYSDDSSEELLAEIPLELQHSALDFLIYPVPGAALRDDEIPYQLHSLLPNVFAHPDQVSDRSQYQTQINTWLQTIHPN